MHFVHLLIFSIIIHYCRKRDAKLQHPMNPYTMGVEGLPHDTLCQHDSAVPLFNNHVKLKEGGEYQQYRYRDNPPITPVHPGMVVESIKPTETSDSGSSGELIPPPYIDGIIPPYIDGIAPARHGLSTFRQSYQDDHVYESPP